MEGISKYSEFFTTAEAEEIWSALLSYFSEEIEEAEVEITKDAGTYRFKADVKKDIGSVVVGVKITAAGDLRAVSFSKESGSTIDFMMLFNDLK